MRLIVVLAAVLGLAVGVVLAEEQVEDQQEEHVTLEVEGDEDGTLDVHRLFRALFANEEEDAAAEEAEGAEGEVEGRSKGDEETVDTADLSRYNSFVDTVFRRINSHSRARSDPLNIGLSSKKKGKSKGKKGKKGKDDVESENGEGEENEKAKGKKGKGKKKGKKGKKEGNKEKGEKKQKRQNRKSNRHPKDLNLEEVEDEVEQVEEVVDETEVAAVPAREKREADEPEMVDEAEDEGEVEGLDREGRDVIPDLDDDAAAESPRKNNNKTGKKGKNKGNKKGKKDKKNKNEDNNDKKGKKNKKNKNGKRSKKSLPRVRTSRATVTGIATLRREGNVKVVNKKGAKEIRAQFVLGPVDLKVARKYGFGKGAVTRDARAVSPELKGKMSIVVSADGKARVSKFFIAKPSIVRVEGTLHKEVRGANVNNNFMEKSLSRVTPVATKRLKAAARDVLSVSQTRN